MNALLKPAIAAMLLASTGTVFAASSAELTVTGFIIPGSCTPTLSNNGKVDLGKMAFKDMNVDRPTPLPRKTLQLTLTCEGGAIMVSVSSTDNRDGSDWNNDRKAFGLGYHNGTEKIGAMTLQLSNPLADNKPVRTIASLDGGTTWSPETNLTRDNLLSVTDSATDMPIPLESMTSNVDIDAEIGPTQNITGTSDVNIDGSVTLRIKYL